MQTVKHLVSTIVNALLYIAYLPCCVDNLDLFIKSKSSPYKMYVFANLLLDEIIVSKI